MKQNEVKHHHLYFFNVPAPIYAKDISPQLNAEVASTVIKFNAAIQENAKKDNFALIDVHKLTAEDNGFSNGHFHIDKKHLGPKAILEFERQLNY